MGRRGLLVYVRCTKVIPGVGCSVHPTTIGEDIRPEFCSLPKPPSEPLRVEPLKVI